MSVPSFMTSAAPFNPLSLPSGYHPVHELILCSNILLNVRAPILVTNIPVLLVGKGPIPTVWLAAPADKDRRQWSYIVEKSISMHPIVKVDIDVDLSEVTVQITGTTVLRVRSRGNDKAEVTQLDFRLIGLNLEGSETGLKIGASNLSANTITNALSAVSLS